MIRLVIKGSSERANEAAKTRGIVLLTRKQLGNKAWDTVETVAECSSDYLPKLTAWFCETDPEYYSGKALTPDGPCPPEGMPEGTLLFYSDGTPSAEAQEVFGDL
jgi:hypothetical protein